MSEVAQLHEPWMLAVWSGMGSVALLAGEHLLHQLKPRRAAELDAHGYFDVKGVEVKNGIATVARLPRNMIFEWEDPEGSHDLLIFVGEAQPARGGYALCEKLVEYAAGRGVKDVFTFAAMASGLELGTPPRTLAVATDQPTLKRLTDFGVEVLEEGQISGLNGVLLAAAAERGMHGTCLLGEIPYFGVEVPNPRGARAVLERFCEMSGILVNTDQLAHQAEMLEENLRVMLSGEGHGEEEPGEKEHYGEVQVRAPKEPKARRLNEETREWIEALFEVSAHDRSKAVELKKELDRLGVFKEYENRFLDLFRKAE